MKGWGDVLLYSYREVQLIEACMWGCSGPDSALGHSWELPLKWQASIRLPTCPPLTAVVTRSHCLCMSGEVMCRLVNCLWCCTYNIFPGSLPFPQPLFYQPLPENWPTRGPQQQFWWIFSVSAALGLTSNRWWFQTWTWTFVAYSYVQNFYTRQSSLHFKCYILRKSICDGSDWGLELCFSSNPPWNETRFCQYFLCNHQSVHLRKSNFCKKKENKKKTWCFLWNKWGKVNF